MFEFHRLNGWGQDKAKEIQRLFTELVASLRVVVGEERGSSWVRGTEKLEEACFFIKKSMAVLLENQAGAEDVADESMAAGGGTPTGARPRVLGGGLPVPGKAGGDGPRGGDPGVREGGRVDAGAGASVGRVILRKSGREVLESWARDGMYQHETCGQGCEVCVAKAEWARMKRIVDSVTDAVRRID